MNDRDALRVGWWILVLIAVAGFTGWGLATDSINTSGLLLGYGLAYALRRLGEAIRRITGSSTSDETGARSRQNAPPATRHHESEK